MNRGLAQVMAVVMTAATLALAVDVGVANAAETETDRKRRAKAFVEEGNRKYDLGKYDEAIALYEQAYEIWPHPETLFNLCQSYRQKKDLERAVFYCKSYLRNDPTTSKRAAVEQRIAEMEEAVAAAKQTVEKPPQEVAPAGEGGADGSTGSGTDASTGLVTTPPVGPAAAPIDAPGATSRWYQDGLAWTLVGGGAVLLGTGGVLFVSAGGLRDDGDAALTPVARDDLYADADSRDLLGYVAIGAGAAALVVGVVKLVSFEPEGQAKAKATGTTTSWTLRPARSGLGVVWSGRF